MGSQCPDPSTRSYLHSPGFKNLPQPDSALSVSCSTDKNRERLHLSSLNRHGSIRRHEDVHLSLVAVGTVQLVLVLGNGCPYVKQSERGSETRIKRGAGYEHASKSGCTRTRACLRGRVYLHASMHVERGPCGKVAACTCTCACCTTVRRTTAHDEVGLCKCQLVHALHRRRDKRRLMPRCFEFSDVS